LSEQAAPPAQRSGRIGLGAMMIVVGIVLVTWPRATALVVVTLLGLGVLLYGLTELARVFSAADGRLDLVAGVVALLGATARQEDRVERLMVGVLSLIAGALTLALPALSLVVLVWFAGLWLILVGAVVAGLTVVGSAGRRTDGDLPPIR